MIPLEQVRDNVRRMRAAVDEAALRAGRLPEDVRLLAATKTNDGAGDGTTTATLNGSNRRFFAKMYALSVDISAKKYDNVSMNCLSMGMSGDFADAIAEGATLVRIGSAIFGPRA